MSAVNNSFDKKDMEIILEINRKAIEIESEAVSQNEEIIDLISTHKDKLDILNSEIRLIVWKENKTALDIEWKQKIVIIRIKKRK